MPGPLCVQLEGVAPPESPELAAFLAGALRAAFFLAGAFFSALFLAALFFAVLFLAAAFLAGLGVGLWKDLNDIRKSWVEERHFKPALSKEEVRAKVDQWEAACAKL